MLYCATHTHTHIYVAYGIERHSRSAVMVNPVDLASNEHSDLAVLPPLLVGQQVRDEQRQAWSEQHTAADSPHSHTHAQHASAVKASVLLEPRVCQGLFTESASIFSV